MNYVLKSILRNIQYIILYFEKDKQKIIYYRLFNSTVNMKSETITLIKSDVIKVLHVTEHITKIGDESLDFIILNILNNYKVNLLMNKDLDKL